MAEKKVARNKKSAKKRETGTAGQSGETGLPPSEALPRDPQELGRPMTPDERVDESSLESMDGSDPPSYTPIHSGGPKRPEDEAAKIDETEIRSRAYELWDQEGRPPGRHEEYWHRAERELRQRRGG